MVGPGLEVDAFSWRATGTLGCVWTGLKGICVCTISFLSLLVCSGFTFFGIAGVNGIDLIVGPFVTALFVAALVDPDEVVFTTGLGLGGFGMVLGGGGIITSDGDGIDGGGEGGVE